MPFDFYSAQFKEEAVFSHAVFEDVVKFGKALKNNIKHRFSQSFNRHIDIRFLWWHYLKFNWSFVFSMPGTT